MQKTAPSNKRHSAAGIGTSVPHTPVSLYGEIRVVNKVTDQNDKSALRKAFCARRSALTVRQRQECDRAIRAALRLLPEYHSASMIAAFIPWGAEVDLTPLFGEKELLLPRFNPASGCYEMVQVRDLGHDLAPGKYGIPEPLPRYPALPAEEAGKRALFLVPSVACDASGTRLGRGGGYYDRLLQTAEKPAIAVLYSCQFSDRPLPREKHDLPMGIIVTETQTIRTNQRRKGDI